MALVTRSPGAFCRSYQCPFQAVGCPALHATDEEALSASAVLASHLSLLLRGQLETRQELAELSSRLRSENSDGAPASAKSPPAQEALRSEVTSPSATSGIRRFLGSALDAAADHEHRGALPFSASDASRSSYTTPGPGPGPGTGQAQEAHVWAEGGEPGGVERGERGERGGGGGGEELLQLLQDGPAAGAREDRDDVDMGVLGHRRSPPRSPVPLTAGLPPAAGGAAPSSPRSPNPAWGPTALPSAASPASASAAIARLSTSALLPGGEPANHLPSAMVSAAGPESSAPAPAPSPVAAAAASASGYGELARRAFSPSSSPERRPSPPRPVDFAERPPGDGLDSGAAPHESRPDVGISPNLGAELRPHEPENPSAASSALVQAAQVSEENSKVPGGGTTAADGEAFSLLNSVTTELQAGRIPHAEAATTFSALIEALPPGRLRCSALLNRACCYVGMSQFEPALADIETIIADKAPDVDVDKWHKVWMSRGGIHRKLAQASEAQASASGTAASAAAEAEETSKVYYERSRGDYERVLAIVPSHEGYVTKARRCLQQLSDQDRKRRRSSTGSRASASTTASAASAPAPSAAETSSSSAAPAQALGQQPGNHRAFDQHSPHPPAPALQLQHQLVLAEQLGADAAAGGIGGAGGEPLSEQRTAQKRAEKAEQEQEDQEQEQEPAAKRPRMESKELLLAALMGRFPSTSSSSGAVVVSSTSSMNVAGAEKASEREPQGGFEGWSGHVRNGKHYGNNDERPELASSAADPLLHLLQPQEQGQQQRHNLQERQQQQQQHQERQHHWLPRRAARSVLDALGEDCTAAGLGLFTEGCVKELTEGAGAAPASSSSSKPPARRSFEVRAHFSAGAEVVHFDPLPADLQGRAQDLAAGGHCTCRLRGHCKHVAAALWALAKEEELGANHLASSGVTGLAAGSESGAAAAGPSSEAALCKKRDALERTLEKKTIEELKRYLKLNNQIVSGTKTELVRRVADGIVFGSVAPCPNCGGHLHPELPGGGALGSGSGTTPPPAHIVFRCRKINREREPCGYEAAGNLVERRPFMGAEQYR